MHSFRNENLPTTLHHQILQKDDSKFKKSLYRLAHLNIQMTKHSIKRTPPTRQHWAFEVSRS